MAKKDDQTDTAGPTTKKDRFSIYLDPDQLGRYRAAAPFAMAFGKYTSMSEWVAALIEADVRNIENKVNDGQPFEPAGPGETLNTGKSVKPARPAQRKKQ